MLKYEELKAKDLVREAIVLEPSKTLYDARNILLRYNIRFISSDFPCPVLLQ